MRILLVEDDDRLSGFMERGLTEEGFMVTTRTDGYDAEDQATLVEHDVVILDLGLPGQSGLEVLRHIRAAGIQTPVLVLTARDQLADKVRGLDLGADDYLTKPFDFEELLARVRALGRRGERLVLPEIACGPIRMNPAKRSAWCGGCGLTLTHTEFELLQFLCEHPGIVLTRARIEAHVWGVEHDRRTNVVAVYVNYLRKKLSRCSCGGLIETVRGAGYRMRGAE